MKNRSKLVESDPGRWSRIPRKPLYLLENHPFRTTLVVCTWCRGPDSNRQAVKRRIFVTLRLSTPSASTRKANVRALDYAFAIAMRVLHAHRLRRPPSSLYTFRAFRPASAGKKTGLARRCLVARVWTRAFRGFAEFEGFCTGRFRLGTQCFKSAMFTNFITPAGRTRFYHRAAT